MTKAKRKALSKKDFMTVWIRQDGKCALSGKKMRPNDKIHDDHFIPVWMANEQGLIHWWETDEWIDVNDIRNRQLVLKEDHLKKSKKDTGAAAKHKRLTGQTKTGPKAKINSQGFQTNRDGPFKAKFNGPPERRKEGFKYDMH